ncbi:MAG: gliding motility-associated C-terminal domain-containing protein, partial [Flavobacteriaceae bacterium]|nr:gliding motility-associated C-terminal domain-containing protein [Flavobacteriaceae bacterium]
TTYTAQATYTNCNGDVIIETDEVTITFPGAPSITEPISDYQLCDNDGDGSETFDLTSKYEEIVNTLTDITLNYYNTEADANADTNAIATPSTYISSGTETIWVRAINIEGCTSVGFFNLIIDTAPLFTEVPLFQICDDTTPDGFTEFDLDSLYPTIVAGASNLTVSYYLTEEDAEAGAVSPLSSPYTNTINPELIWARVEDDIAGCFGTFVIELNVISPLAGAPTPLIECDQTPNDGIAEFNLTEADTDIINGQTNNLVTYHETLAQAEAGTDALVSPYTNTVPNIQTIFARLEDEVLGCYAVTQLVLQVNPAPSISSFISDYRLCDNDGDGSETFDLTSKYDEIVNTLTGITLTFHNTEADANADTNSIATPSAYISSGIETIWVSSFDNFTQCRVVAPLDLVVSPIPENFQTQEINICGYINVSDLLFDYPDINIYNSPNSIQPLNPSTPLNVGTYYISQLNQFSCESVGIIDVYMSCFPNIPNGFSPNGDGINDYFNIQNLYDVYTEHKLKIFNRYGTLIFEGDNSKKWGGYSESSGDIVPVGTYFYYLVLNNLSNDTFTGWVYINY